MLLSPDPATPGSATIGLAEGHRTLRQVLTWLLSSELGARVNQVWSLQQAVTMLERREVELLLFDQVLADPHLTESIERLRAADPGTAILVLGMGPAEQLQRLVTNAGARGFIRKDLPPTELLDAIRTQLKQPRAD
jgi:DNA-binding NarL/FixJ family response regulator